MTMLLPLLPTPVVLARQLAASVAYYRDTLGFDVVQQVPHTMALVRSEGVSLQLWQQLQPPSTRICRVQLERGVFRLHSHLHAHLHGFNGRHDLAASPAPSEQLVSLVLMPWGSWEFGLRDCDGNRLIFAEWVLPRQRADSMARRHGQA